MVAARFVVIAPLPPPPLPRRDVGSSSVSIRNGDGKKQCHSPLTHSLGCSSSFSACGRFQPLSPSYSLCLNRPSRAFYVLACHPSSSLSATNFNASTKLYVSGLSFRTTEETLRSAFQNFGRLVEVNLVMDRVANRTRGFAFLRYATEQESKKAIEGMHGKFLDGRVIFVEVAKPRSELRQDIKLKRIR
ncbi:hypothetical protein U1Q18_027853 [Sarracenia purpurea var. burkii]